MPSAPQFTPAEQAKWARLTRVTNEYLFPDMYRRQRPMNALEQQEAWEAEEEAAIIAAEREAIANE